VNKKQKTKDQKKTKDKRQRERGEEGGLL